MSKNYNNLLIAYCIKNQNIIYLNTKDKYKMGCSHSKRQTENIRSAKTRMQG